MGIRDLSGFVVSIVAFSKQPSIGEGGLDCGVIVLLRTRLSGLVGRCPINAALTNQDFLCLLTYEHEREITTRHGRS
jgi:hypothetical protein